MLNASVLKIIYLESNKNSCIRLIFRLFRKKVLKIHLFSRVVKTASLKRKFFLSVKGAFLCRQFNRDYKSSVSVIFERMVVC